MVHDAEKLKLLCKILSENSNEELVRSITSVYCVLNCEIHIVQESSYEVMYTFLKEKFLFKHYEEIILQRENNVEKIIDILKDKEIHYFNSILCYLEQKFSSVFTRIKNE